MLSKFISRIGRVNEEECVILTNGPSLNDSISRHFGVLKKKVLVCVNHFPISDYYTQLQPRYYVTSAPDLWLEDIEERFLVQSKKLFDTMADKTDWDLTLFIPRDAKRYNRWQEKIKNNKNIKIAYFNSTPVDGFRWFKHACFSAKLGMPRPHNVLIPCITLSLNLGFKKLIVLGADHSWLPEISVTRENEVLVNQKHFYDEGTSKALPQDKKGKGKRRLDELLMKYVYAFRGYFILREYAESIDARIINATEESFIDAFERMKFENV